MTSAAVAPPGGHFDATLDAFVVTSYAGAEQVLRGRGWSSDLRRNAAAVAQFGGIEMLPPLLTSIMLFTDDEEHQRLRRLVAPAFTSRRMEALRSRVGEIADAAIAGLGDEYDVLHEVAYPVTVGVIAELLDVGVDGAEVILTQTPRLVGLLEIAPTEEQLREAADAMMACMLFFLPLLDDRRQHPGDDFLSALLVAEVDGDRLEMEEVLATTLLLLAAGHETTANLTANAVLLVSRHPDLVDLLAAKPELWPIAVEECLRLESPVRWVGRTALNDQVVDSLPVPAGAQVVVDLSAANRDPARFSSPDVVDLGSADHGHLAFGAGAHFCLGWGLARMEAEEVLRRLFARGPLRLVEPDPPRRESGTFHALERLVVR